MPPLDDELEVYDALTLLKKSSCHNKGVFGPNACGTSTLGLEPTYWQLNDGTYTQAHIQVNTPKT